MSAYHCAYHCAIRTCRARLLGFAYFTLILDNDARIAVCPPCFDKVNAARLANGMERLVEYRSVKNCSICGDSHGESAHGDPLVQRDTGQRTITGLVQTALDDAVGLVNADGIDNGLGSPAHRLRGIRTEWLRTLDDERDEYATEYLDDIDAILSDAGFHAITDGDQGTWAVYAPVVSVPDEALTSLGNQPKSYLHHAIGGWWTVEGEFA